jgi:hypothetical protein
MATKNVIILERLRPASEAMSFRYALWADVPAARQEFFARSGGSRFSGATAAENDAINTGQVAERIEDMSVDKAATVAQIKAALEARWNDFQAEINRNQWDVYGTFWNGTTWTNQGKG